MSSRTFLSGLEEDKELGGGGAAAGGDSRRSGLNISYTLWSLLSIMVSFNLREKFDAKDVSEFNALLASSVRTARSPQTDRDAAVEEASQLDTPSAYNLTKIELNEVPTLINLGGVKILAPVLEGVRSMLHFDVVQRRFQEARSLIDTIRDIFSKHLVNRIQVLLPEIYQLFGEDKLHSLFGLFKNDLKILMIFFGLIVKNNFSDSQNIRKFWFIMLKWMIFSRYIELFVSLLSNIIQFDDGTELKISLDFMKLLRQYLCDITPLSSTLHSLHDFSTRDEIKKFIDAMNIKIVDLNTIIRAISHHILNGEEIKGHLNAINICLEHLERRLSAEKIARKIAKWFNLDLKHFLHLIDPKITTNPVDVITSLLQIAQESNASRYLLENLRDANGIISRIINLRIEHLRDLKRIEEAKQDLEKSKIKTEKFKQKRLAEEIRTAELKADLERRQNKRQCIDQNESKGLAENDLRHYLNRQ
jgi:hypothetical protein